jgi:hypothetical protein
MGLAMAVLAWAVPPASVVIHVRWQEGLTEAARVDLERRFSLSDGRSTGGTTRRYELYDYSSRNIQDLVQHSGVEDTQGIDRTSFSPINPPPSRMARILRLALLIGLVSVVLPGILLSIGSARTGLWTFGERVAALLSSRAVSAAPFSRVVLAALPIVTIVIAVTGTSLPALRSGDRLNASPDYFQYVARHETVRQSIIGSHELPLRSPWLGGGYPNIADPEDPTLNPLVVLSVLFGAVTGLKLISYIVLIAGGISTYALASGVLGYTRWGSLFSALVIAMSPFVPLRMLDGNPNEIYAALLPLCLLLLGLACRGRKTALVALPLVFYVMLSDGKLTALMSMFYVGVLALLATLPGAGGVLSARNEMSGRARLRPLKLFFVAAGLATLIGLPRILPSIELVQSHGGITEMLVAHPKTYDPPRIGAYQFEQLWGEAIGWKGRIGLLTLGWVPVALSGIALAALWRFTRTWAAILALFVWLAMAHHAPVNLLEALWRLPVFEAIYRPDKYFSFQIAFTLALVAGRGFDLLRQLESRWAETVVAASLIAFSVGFLFPLNQHIQRNTYTVEMPSLEAPLAGGFFNIAGRNLPVNRSGPPRALTYLNVQRNVGTLDWYTGLPIPTPVAPRYFVDSANNYLSNPAYRGEAYFPESGGAGLVTAEPRFEPNGIAVPVQLTAPAILIINQNYDRDWHTDRGVLFDSDGLVGLQLNETGRYVVRLRYWPRAFYAGLVLSVLTLAMIAFACWAQGTGRLHNWARQGPSLVASLSRGLIWVGDLRSRDTLT